MFLESYGKCFCSGSPNDHKEMLEVMKLIGNLPGGLGTDKTSNLNFSRDALLSTLAEAIHDKQVDGCDGPINTCLECKDIILMAQDLIQQTETGSEQRKKSLLKGFISKYELSREEIEDIGKILLV